MTNASQSDTLQDAVTGQTLFDKGRDVGNTAPSVGELSETVFPLQVRQEGPCDPGMDSGPDRDRDIVEFGKGEQLYVPFLLDATKLEGELPDSPRTYVRVNRIGGGEIHSPIRNA